MGFLEFAWSLYMCANFQAPPRLHGGPPHVHIEIWHTHTASAASTYQAKLQLTAVHLLFSVGAAHAHGSLTRVCGIPGRQLPSARWRALTRVPIL